MKPIFLWSFPNTSVKGMLERPVTSIQNLYYALLQRKMTPVPYGQAAHQAKVGRLASIQLMDCQMEMCCRSGHTMRPTCTVLKSMGPIYMATRLTFLLWMGISIPREISQLCPFLFSSNYSLSLTLTFHRHRIPYDTNTPVTVTESKIGPTFVNSFVSLQNIFICIWTIKGSHPFWNAI